MALLKAIQNQSIEIVPGPPWLGPVLHRRQLDLQWLLVSLAMLGAGGVFFGWRGLACVGTAALAALAAYLLVWLLLKIIQPERKPDTILHTLALSLLLGLTLPPVRDPTVPMLAGLLTGILMPLVGRTRRLRLQPIAVALIVVWTMPVLLGDREFETLQNSPAGTIEAVLQPDRLLVGDLKNHVDQYSQNSWWSLRNPLAPDAVKRHDPALLVLKERKRMLQFQGLLEEMLQSGELCRLEEVLLGATPGPIGATSRALLILLGVYLMYRRLSSWQAALAATLAALATLLLMPVDIDGHLRFVGGRLLDLPLNVAATYLGYFILASPLALIVLILAPMTTPMTARGQVIYGLALGSLCVAGLWAFAAPQAAFLGLLVASLLSRPLDVMKRSPFTR